MKKLIEDTLMVNGRFSHKRLASFSSFWVAAIYAFLPTIFKDFKVLEFVFLGFMGGTAYAIYRIQKKNENTTE
jgi:hypothetical protein